MLFFVLLRLTFVFVVGILNEVFDNVTYKYNSGLPEQDVRQFGLVKMGNRYSSEDYLKGSYKGIGFEQAEVTIKYDKNGRKQATYKTSGSTTNVYDKYGRKTGYYKKKSNGKVVEYDKYGRKIGTYK